MDADLLRAALRRHLSTDPSLRTEEAFCGGLRFEHEGRTIAVTDRQVLDALADLAREADPDGAAR